eukprot:tig00000944_g5955.t1
MVQPVTQASITTRIQDWVKQTPLVTRWLLLVNVAIYICVLLFGFDYSYVCNNPASVFYRYHVFRWFTAPFFHVGILHIVFNMMAFHPMGSSLERIVGSFNFLYLQLLFMLAAGVIDFVLAVLMVWPVTIWAMPFMECGVGYSGIIFGMLVVESHHSQSEYRSIFGFFNVPAKYYPWAMLIVLQIVAQGVSFMGHLSGMLAGYLYVYRLLDVFMLPSVLANKMDTSFIGSRQGWITNPGYAGCPLLFWKNRMRKHRQCKQAMCKHQQCKLLS